ncbi:type III pantothenate kinase [Methylomagnum sp.]
MMPENAAESGRPARYGRGQDARASSLVLVDIGNSRLKWGRAEQGRIVAGGAFATDEAAPARLDSEWSALPAPDAVQVSNVAGAVIAEKLEDWMARRWRVPVQFARSEAQACGVSNGYERPEQLGVDRWVALIAARHHCPLPVCVVDAGTALTVDVLDGEGRHLGGLIAPGPALMKRALRLETRGVQAVDGGASGWLGRNTADGVAGGVLRAAAGLIENTQREASERLGHAPSLILCGGAGEAIGRLLAIPYRLDPDLVLRGLLILADKGS